MPARFHVTRDRLGPGRAPDRPAPPPRDAGSRSTTRAPILPTKGSSAAAIPFSLPHAVRKSPVILALALLAVAAAIPGIPARARASDFQGATHLMPFDEDLIGYGKTRETNDITRLQQRIDEGAARLTRDARGSLLASILHALSVPASSQALVFSKTSFQRDRIGPSNPRALYFNESVYVGHVPGSAILEFTAVDPAVGAVFYTLDESPAQRPRFVRTDQCTECHASARTMGVPGHLVRSFETDESGMVDLLTAVDPVNHRTPLADRWGGWFVTGLHGTQTHRGNLVGKAAHERQRTTPNHSGNITTLSRWIEPSKYLAPTSDIVALMVLEHQQHGQNFITRLGYEARLQLSAYGHVQYLRPQIDAFLRYVLFADEARLAGPIEGSPAFRKDFVNGGKRDSKGRSLRELDLRTRLFAHPCSFLLQGEAFAALPAALRHRILERLDEALAPAQPTDASRHIPPSERAILREILADTVPGYPQSPRWPPANQDGAGR